MCPHMTSKFVDETAQKSSVFSSKATYTRGLMKKLLSILLLFVFALNATEHPHLIIHFDINKTLIASDSTENKTTDDVINELLSKKYTACWDEFVKEPITFEAYVKASILPGPDHDPHLKEQRLVHLIHFIDYLQKNNHALYATAQKEYTRVKSILDQSSTKVFPSFYQFVNEINKKGIPYTLFLRSFGQDVFEVTNEINSIFPDLFTSSGSFKKGILHLQNNEILEKTDAIHQFFLSKQNAAIRDDWHHWMQGKMEAKFGKPFYLEPENKNVLCLFFDDNIKLNSPDKNVVGPLHGKTGESLCLNQLIEKRQVIPVNTLEAIANPRYYIEHLEEALKINQNNSHKN